MNLIQVSVDPMSPPVITGDQGHWLPAFNWQSAYQNADIRNGMKALYNVVPSNDWGTLSMPPAASKLQFAVWRDGGIVSVPDLPPHGSAGWVVGVSGEGYTEWATLAPPKPYDAPEAVGPVAYLCTVGATDTVFGFSNNDDTITVTPHGIVSALSWDFIWERTVFDDEGNEVSDSQGASFVKMVWLEGPSQLILACDAWVAVVSEATGLPDVIQEGSVEPMFQHEPGWEILATLASLVSFKMGSISMATTGEVDVAGAVSADDFVVEYETDEGPARVSLSAIAEAFNDAEVKVEEALELIRAYGRAAEEQADHFTTFRNMLQACNDRYELLTEQVSSMETRLGAQGRQIVMHTRDLESVTDRLEELSATVTQLAEGTLTSP